MKVMTDVVMMEVREAGPHQVKVTEKDLDEMRTKILAGEKTPEGFGLQLMGTRSLGAELEMFSRLKGGKFLEKYTVTNPRVAGGKLICDFEMKENGR